MSQFVLEALDLPKDAARAPRARAIEELRRHAPDAGVDGTGAAAPMPDDEPLAVSHNQVDDYETCPLKYHYIHILRIPLRQHHSVVYGSALHKAVEFYLRRRAAGNFTLARGLPPGLRGRLAQRGVSHARARGAAPARRHAGAHALLPRGGGVGRRGRRRSSRSSASSSGPRACAAASTGWIRRRRLGDRRLQVERRDRAEEGRPAGEGEPPAQDLRAGLEGDDRAGSRSRWSCASSSPGWPAATVRPRRTWRRRARRSRAPPAASGSAASTRRPATRPAATARTTRSARARRRRSEPPRPCLARGRGYDSVRQARRTVGPCLASFRDHAEQGGSA